ncbi:hypothetical protein VPH35_014588 [Triticum aestivum]
MPSGRWRYGSVSISEPYPILFPHPPRRMPPPLPISTWIAGSVFTTERTRGREAMGWELASMGRSEPRSTSLRRSRCPDRCHSFYTQTHQKKKRNHGDGGIGCYCLRVCPYHPGGESHRECSVHSLQAIGLSRSRPGGTTLFTTSGQVVGCRPVQPVSSDAIVQDSLHASALHTDYPCLSLDMRGGASRRARRSTPLSCTRSFWEHQTCSA